jgi:regulator of protease activity HflC (stomatin/prohibitin superfamily)
VTNHVLHFEGDKLRHGGRGLAFWYTPWTASLCELPMDDRELALTFHGRSADFQDVTVLGVLTYRIVDPRRAALRIDFSIDPRRGTWLKQPLEKIGLLLSQLAQQHALGYLQATPLRTVLAEGHARLRAIVDEALRAPDAAAGAAPGLLDDLGLALVSVRISDVKPSADLERALEAPARERIQEQSDEAAFRRRAQAVEKERAIQENELQNQIELARREQQLIEQRGQNGRREATEKAEAARIETEARALQTKTDAEARAESIRAVEGAQFAVDRERLETYRGMPPAVVAALAVQALAGKLQRIDHLNITPDLIGTLLGGLVEAGTRRLDGGGRK